MATDYGQAYLEAKSHGYSDDDIAQYLAGSSSKYQEAVNNGYTPQDIIKHFTNIDLTLAPGMRPAGDYADLSSEQPTPLPGSSMALASNDQGLQAPPEIKALNAINTAGAGYGLGQLAGLATKGVGNIYNYFSNALNAPKVAQAMAPTEDALSLGMRAQASKAKQLQELKDVNDSIYAKIPQDFRAVTPNVNQAAENVIAAQASLPKSFQSPQINKIASDLQELGKSSGTPFATIKDIRSQLSDMAYNGEGTDKLYAGQLLGALNKDITSIGNSPASLSNVPSQQPTAMAQDLREMWADIAKNSRQPELNDITAQMHYVNPQIAQPVPGQLSNADIGQNLNEANALFKQRMDLQNHPVTQALSRARPEEMWKVAFSRGNVSDVNTAKQALGPVGFNAVKQQFYDQLLNARDLGTKLSKYSPEFLNAALGPDMLRGLQNLAAFKQLISRAAIAGGAAAAATSLGGFYRLGHKMF